MESKLKVAITGAAGLVGSRIAELLGASHDVIPLTRGDIDITNKNNVESALASHEFDYLIHCAAYTNVDAAEQDKKQAYAINVDGVRNIFEVCEQKGAKLVHISTDFVFDGTHPPYFEDSDPRPLSVYARSKFEGEQIIKDKAMIVRISYPYRAGHTKNDFARTIKNLLEESKPIRAVSDSLFTPTFIDDIAAALNHLLSSYSPDIYHVVGSQALSPFDATHAIAAQYNLNASLITKVSFEEFFKGRALRPQYSDIRSSKNDYFPMRAFDTSIFNIDN